MTITKIFNIIIDSLPRHPRSFDMAESELWTDGEMILCPYEADAQKVIDFLLLFDSEYVGIVISYFDPVEDYRNGERDEYTGFWSVEII